MMGRGLMLLSAFLALIQLQLSVGQLCNQKMDVVLLVDRVFSLHALDENKWDRLLSMVVSITAQLDVRADHTRVGLVAFNKTATNELFLRDTGTHQTVAEAIHATKAYFRASEINIADALRVMRTEQFSPTAGDRGTVRNVAVVISGGPTMGMADAVRQAEFAQSQNIKIYAIGIGMNDTMSLASLPREQNKNYFVAKSIIELETLLGDIGDAICSQTEQQPEEVPNDDPEYLQKNPSLDMLDLVFVIDLSDAIRRTNPDDGSYDNWNLMIEYIISIVNSLKVNPNGVRVGIVTFSDTASPKQFLSESGSKEQVVANLGKLEYSGGGANLAEGLRIMQDVVLRDNGQRPYLDVAVILTTGVIDKGTKSAVLEQARKAQERNIHMVSVGIGSVIDEEILRKISSPPHKANHNYFRSAASPQDIIDHLLPSPVPDDEDGNTEENTVILPGDSDATSTKKQSSSLATNLIHSGVLIYVALLYGILCMMK